MVTTASPELSAIGALVLARLLLVGEKGETSANIQRDLGPFFQHWWSRSTLAEELKRTLGELESIGLVTILRGKTRKSVPRVVPTPEGRRRALGFLHIDRIRPKTTWTTLRKVYLPAQVLGQPASTDASIKALASDPGFKAALLKQQFQLPAAELPRLDEVLDALAWKLIGFGQCPCKFTLKAVKTALFNRELGNGRTTDFKQAAAQLLAKRLGARGGDTKELRDAVVRNWVVEHVQPPAGGAAARDGDAAPIVAAGVELALPAFAARVQAVAATCTTGRYGGNKVFISHVWEALQSDPFFRNMGLAAFKDRLAQANNARLLDLSRADLVQAMDPGDVRASEVQYLSATFHFVRI